MVVEQTKLAVILLYSVVLGIFFGVIYGVFKIRRTYFPIKQPKAVSFFSRISFETLLTFFEDVFFALICSVMTCVFVYYMNAGRLRGMVLFGGAAGFLIYYNTLGGLVLKCSGYVITFLGKVIRKIISLTVVPLLRLMNRILGGTVGWFFAAVYTLARKSAELWAADKGFGLIRKKGRVKNEKAVKYFHESGGIRVHRVLHGNHNKNAV